MLRAPQSAFCAEEQSSSLWLRVRAYACACACVGWLGHFCTAWGVQPEIAAAVALGEFERMDDLVAMRTAVGLAFMTAIEGCSWLKPQKVLEGCVSSWYTVGLLIERPDVAWLEFRRKFVEMGGDGFCECAKIARTLVLRQLSCGCLMVCRVGADAPPSPLHREPVFDSLVRAVEANPQRYPHWVGRLPSYADGTCPVWERLQPKVMLLKTNYFDVERFTGQAQALKDTIDWFDRDRGAYDRTTA